MLYSLTSAPLFKMDAKLSEAVAKYGFTSAIKWTGGDEAKFEAGVGAWADASKGFSFGKGKGQVGRVLESGAYEWCANVQNLPGDQFVRLDASKSTGIKTVFGVAVSGGIVEMASTEEKAEDKSIVDAIKAMF
eukprot:Mrub_10956.p2 GENE.Mrub_10956~~Mrub_10956.p2  ORF type:complete len:133 (-),score=37.02 Mrub_10956:60-458(-)